MTTKHVAISAEKPVLAPLLKFNADRENEPDTGIPPLNADAILASP